MGIIGKEMETTGSIGVYRGNIGGNIGGYIGIP